MLGRMVLPIIFHDGEKEILVKEIYELKDYFKDEYIPELVDAVKTIRLQQFFFGNGRDDIKDLIVSLKEQGVSEIEILNQVAERLGFPKLDGSKLESNNSFDEFLTDDSESCNLTEKNLYLKKHNIIVSNSKTVRSIKLNGNVILDDSLVLNIKNNSEVIFKAFSFKGDNRVLNLKMDDGCRVLFLRCSFVGVDVVVEGGEAEFDNCSISKSEYGIVGISSKLVIKNCEIFENKNGGLRVENGSFLIEGSKFFSNGNEDGNCSQMSIIGSTGQIDGSSVYKGVNADGISCIGNSEITISNSKVFENYYNGVEIRQSKFNIIQSEIYSNGNDEDIYPQIWIESSTGQIDSSSVYKSVNATGISCLEKSEITISNSKVFENYYYGIGIHQSKFNINKSEIFSNGNDKGYYPQIWIESSTGQIDGSSVYNGVKAGGIYCRENSEITISNSKVFENYYNGISIKQSKFNIIQSEIYSNGNNKGSYPQIWIESSTGQIDGSSVYNGVNAHGIYVKSSKVELLNVKTWGNKAGIDNDTQSNITKTNCDFKESGCFITTAVVKTLGKDDNCYELNTFRKYRDSYIKSLPDGDAIISEYYSIAPKIVEKIEQQSNKEQIYNWIWNKFLKPCLEYIEQGKYKETKEKYTHMVKTLADKYLM